MLLRRISTNVLFWWKSSPIGWWWSKLDQDWLSGHGVALVFNPYVTSSVGDGMRSKAYCSLGVTLARRLGFVEIFTRSWMLYELFLVCCHWEVYLGFEIEARLEFWKVVDLFLRWCFQSSINRWKCEICKLTNRCVLINPLLWVYRFNHTRLGTEAAKFFNHLSRYLGQCTLLRWYGNVYAGMFGRLSRVIFLELISGDFLVVGD